MNNPKPKFVANSIKEYLQKLDIKGVIVAKATGAKVHVHNYQHFRSIPKKLKIPYNSIEKRGTTLTIEHVIHGYTVNFYYNLKS